MSNAVTVGAALIGLVGAVVAALIVAGKLPPSHRDPAGRIESPAASSNVGREFTVSGTLSDIPGDDHVWLAVQVGNLLFPKEPEIAHPSGGYSEQIVEGGSPPGGRFSLVLLRVGEEGQTAIERWLSALRRGEEPPGLAEIEGADVLDALANLRLTGG